VLYRSGYAFTVSVTTWFLEIIASSVENVLNPCFLLMSNGQGNPSHRAFLHVVLKISENRSSMLDDRQAEVYSPAWLPAVRSCSVSAEHWKE